MKRIEMVVLVFVLILAGCGGSGGDAAETITGKKNSSVPDVAAGFSPDPAIPVPVTPKTAWMGLARTSGNTLTLDVFITDTNDVNTVSFDVVYDPFAVDYIGFNTAQLLEQGGNNPTYQVSEQTGRIVVGASRAGTTGTNATGNVSTIELVFEVNQAGNHELSIENGVILNGSSAVVSGMSWFGGDAVGN